MAVNSNGRGNEEVVFRIVSKVGILAEYQTGWTKEVNIVSWNEGNPKFDIRDWNPEHDHMSRGITLHEGEARQLVEVLSEHFFGCRPGEASAQYTAGSKGKPEAAAAQKSDGETTATAAADQKSNGETTATATAAQKSDGETTATAATTEQKSDEEAVAAAEKEDSEEASENCEEEENALAGESMTA